MPKVKIRHGLAYYLVKVEGRDDLAQRTAFRGQVINVSENEAKRLKELNAAVDADEELPMLGRITPLPNTASDEELLAWVSVATQDEIARAIAQAPALADRLQAARDTHDERMKKQSDFLSGLDDTIKRGRKAAKAADRRKSTQVKDSAPTTGVNGKNVTATVPENEEDLDELEPLDEEEEELEEDDPREVVKGNVDHISKFLNDNPEQIQAVLDAEQEAAKQENREVRKGVIDAAAVAANSRNQ